MAQEQAGSAETRRSLLGSLAAFQEDRRAAHLSTSRVRAAATAAAAPGPGSWREAHAPRVGPCAQARDPGPAPSAPPQPPPPPQAAPAKPPGAGHSGGSAAGSSLPARDQPAPSAPPLPVRPAGHQHDLPSAPPAPTQAQVRPQPLHWRARQGTLKAGSDTSPAQGEAQPEECGICMEAGVEVWTSCKPVRHGMCIECARAVCSMKARAAGAPAAAPPLAQQRRPRHARAGARPAVPLLQAGHHLCRAGARGGSRVTAATAPCRTSLYRVQGAAGGPSPCCVL